MSGTEVRIIGWGPEVGEWLNLVFALGVVFGLIAVTLGTAVAVAILTRRS